jgi:hypothetical protein
MLRDVLAKAVDEIERCQRDDPDSYKDLAVEIAVVKTVMSGLRLLLEVSPDRGTGTEPLRTELAAALKGLPLAELDSVLNRVMYSRHRSIPRANQKGAPATL